MLTPSRRTAASFSFSCLFCVALYILGSSSSTFCACSSTCRAQTVLKYVARWFVSNIGVNFCNDLQNEGGVVLGCYSI
ncbi:hypothetical protein ECANGB1_2641 [Enterospora canceri]|uniref:Secreted protein n=1 Tax=Enterospora canceri TaxID=1081671 RepID=A0A1Y1S9N3_9MICR|nr:hypothetical protein ECANGB1_2641 [Enterospora canceri]